MFVAASLLLLLLRSATHQDCRCYCNNGGSDTLLFSNCFSVQPLKPHHLFLLTLYQECYASNSDEAHHQWFWRQPDVLPVQHSSHSISAMPS
mmetsp:Transcript_22262/g.38368  ORF Transcript_22262/g.38368 Transcript_22262/m.38368 type:complete len:92 (-) Transcript_22262:67-342(-)